ncbi:hypothetical protein SAMN02745121_02032 [Nannocystis exedens]|uniref:Uncharacterized protein n=1 Tax=Nannocystis exedens TaxID=54 RepID=A0A1I1VWV0_9BACT|nr:hypothetical protein [Nannocystis exedens]PCC72914.1 hypothetical protein NAEX_06000 [Nannocystis exedens]SFD87361.1 hypothetical protein SAMN02745121_02032 [Nannocystis exedens]
MSTESSTGTTAPGTAGLTTTTAPDPASEPTTSLDTGTGSTTSTATTGDGTFIIPFDGGTCGAAFGEYQVRCTECNTWVQDCWEGAKCSPYSGDGDADWEALKCVDLDPAPDHPGDPCTVEGHGASGVDSCDGHSMCFHVDPDTLGGTCVPFCQGSPETPECPAGTTCMIANEGVIALCLPTCDPLAQTCPEGQACVAASVDPDAFFCLPGAGGQGQAFDSCDAACDPGLWCGEPELAGECDPEALGCCLPFCDLNLPQCPGPMLQCLPFFALGDAPAGLEHLGLCRLP